MRTGIVLRDVLLNQLRRQEGGHVGLRRLNAGQALDVLDLRHNTLHVSKQ